MGTTTRTGRRTSTGDDTRARIGVRHALAADARIQDPVAIAAALVGLHGTDPASMFLSATVRQVRPDLRDIEHALYDTRTIVRVLGMRRTVFAVPRALVPAIHAAYLDRNGPGARKLLHLVLAGIAGGSEPSFLAEVTAQTLAALAARRAATAAELTADVPSLAHRFTFVEGKAYEGSQSLATRLLFLLAVEGRIVRGRPRGGVTSSLYRWVRTGDWLPDLEGLSIGPAAATARLVRAYLERYGPATEVDIAWWTGLTKGAVRAAIATIEVAATPLGLVLANDTAPVEAPAPWAALLPALDPTPMGWTNRSRFLDPTFRPALFDRSGNIGPTVWVDGRIVGGWAQLRNGDIAVQLLEVVGRAERARIDERVDALRTSLGDLRFVPRFRTPLEKELAGRAGPSR